MSSNYTCRSRTDTLRLQCDYILPNGLLEPHSDALSRLVKRLGISEDDMFRSQALTIDAAYEAQGERIAYDRKVPRRARSERLAVRFTEGDRS